ncbi:MAG: DUF4236 domain-containing protein [Candidatus Obscuribacterales bacterium]|nr:DUF4236 domain-containing protein [Candidatus Obscuribacterales bacterium]
MGWRFRFRRSKKLGPMRVTQTQSGTSLSFGIPGLRYTWRANGEKQITVGIPGSGLSWVKRIKKRSSNP